MKKNLLIMLFVLTLLLTGCSKPANNEIGGEETEKSQKETILSYENKQYRLKLDFPSTRNFKENVYGATVMFFAPEKKDKTTENLGITVKLIDSGANLETLYTDNKNMLKEIAEDFTIENEKSIKIDNYPAKQIQYSFSQGEYKIKQEQIIVIKDEILYMIGYTATQDTFDDYKKEVNAIIESIRIR
ncbi:hypothetical protein P148_SR1C00001G0657 [candidate division SR1 bacterium RAAC1_SR1_1]|nr:hypothetical protein P148_SR1C00001G0657 [candidate division SR1 bacterium RAAC1_SR1_1]